LDPTKKSNFDPLEEKVVLTHEAPSTSKKSDDVRRKELLQFIQPKLITMCENKDNIIKLLQSRSGGNVLVGVCSMFGSQVNKAVVDAISSNPVMFEDPIAHIAIKKLIKDKEKSNLAELLVIKYEGKLLNEVGSSNRGAIILTKLLDIPSVCDNIRSELNKNIKSLKDKAKKASIKKGYEVLIEKLADKSNDEEDEDEVAPLPSKEEIAAKTPARKQRTRKPSIADGDDDVSISSVGSLYSEGGTPLRRSARGTPRKNYKI